MEVTQIRLTPRLKAENLDHRAKVQTVRDVAARGTTGRLWLSYTPWGGDCETFHLTEYIVDRAGWLHTFPVKGGPGKAYGPGQVIRTLDTD